MIRPLSALLALCVATSAVAHDFWIDLGVWKQDRPGAAIPLGLLVGTSAEREAWRMRAERIVSLKSIGQAGIIDQMAAIIPGTDTNTGGSTIQLSGPGSHIVALETTPALSDLPAAEFDAYVSHEGLIAVAAHRVGSVNPGTNGRELYARRAKAIVQIGPSATSNILKPIGQSLEIVPLANPHARGATRLPVKVMFRGKPLPGTRVSLENLTDTNAATQIRTTDADGKASFPLSQSGVWKLATVWSVPMEDTRMADYDTLFASLTFGY